MKGRDNDTFWFKKFCILFMNYNCWHGIEYDLEFDIMRYRPSLKKN